MKSDTIIVLSFAILFFSCSRTPQFILKQYGVDLSHESYSIELFKDHSAWQDLETSIIIRNIKLSEDNINVLIRKGAQNLPTNSIKGVPKWFEPHLSSQKGLYILEGKPECGDYYFLVYDDTNNSLLFYNLII